MGVEDVVCGDVFEGVVGDVVDVVVVGLDVVYGYVG